MKLIFDLLKNIINYQKIKDKKIKTSTFLKIQNPANSKMNQNLKSSSSSSSEN